MLNSEYIDKEGSVKWLRNGLLKYDRERIILGAQDHGLTTRAILHLHNKSTEFTCRFCQHQQESSSHLLSCCNSLLNQVEYTIRHDKVCSLIHWNILGDKKIIRSEKCCYTDQKEEH